MEDTPAYPSRHHVSECPLPQLLPSVSDASYIATPLEAVEGLPGIKSQALAIVADAGLSAMPLSVQCDLDTDDALIYRLYAHNSINDKVAVYAYGDTPVALLAQFSQRLGSWAIRKGLLPEIKTMRATPEQLRAGVEAGVGKMLTGMAAVLLLAIGFGRCAPVHQVPAEAHDLRAEHARPAHYDRYAWREVDTLE